MWREVGEHRAGGRGTRQGGERAHVRELYLGGRRRRRRLASAARRRRSIPPLRRRATFFRANLNSVYTPVHDTPSNIHTLILLNNSSRYFCIAVRGLALFTNRCSPTEIVADKLWPPSIPNTGCYHHAILHFLHTTALQIWNFFSYQLAI